MNAILSDNYFVEFQQHAYKKLDNYIQDSKPSSIFILVDENSEKCCIPVFKKAIDFKNNFDIIRIKSGEEFKNLETCHYVWNELTVKGADRKGLLINLGGGVITDLGGFAASTFKRGMAFINIPTTLLSMVDASVGGKTGIDLGVLKNQIGLFSNPKMVLIDNTYLRTVSARELRSGLAEIIKYGFTFDYKIWEKISTFKDLKINDITPLIHQSIEIKNNVVIEDPTEKSLRKVLNFGHTLGHAVESYFLNAIDKENLTHGEAIAIGMVTELFLSHKIFNFPINEVVFAKEKIIDLYGKVTIHPSEFSEILALLIHDKKNISGKVNFVLLKDFEKFELDVKVAPNLLLEALEYYIS